jgi:hypothetical protein
MTITKLAVVLVCLMPVTLGPKEAKVTPLFSKDLPDFHDHKGISSGRLGPRTSPQHRCVCLCP